MRLGYHITEDIFVEGVVRPNQGQRRASTGARSCPAAVSSTPKRQTLKYYNLSVGYNMLPGEVFFGSNTAKATALYLIGGVGSTNFDKQRRQTFNFGLGVRVLLADWFSVQVDMRDHIFSLDLLGKRENTQNLEMTAGLTFYF